MRAWHKTTIGGIRCLGKDAAGSDSSIIGRVALAIVIQAIGQSLKMQKGNTAASGVGRWVSD
jgi:hypothetical protein